MNLLIFDTSTDACSCALRMDGGIIERHELAPRRHAQLLLGMVEDLLADGGLSLNSLDAVGFGRGPGSFTGVRIAASTAQALALGADLPVVPVSSLAALAQNVQMTDGATRIAAAFDARMQEVYWGLFEAGDDGVVREVSPEQVCAPSTLSLPRGEQWTGAGGGWQTYETELRERLASNITRILCDRYPTARAASVLAADAFRSGDTVDAKDALPVYLRDRVTRG